MPRVLVVDDELGIRATLQEFLRDEGYEVETASEVEEAVQRLKVRPFDVIVTDIVMPRASGVDLLKFIHETQPLAQVILITGEPMLDTATQALRAGAFDYLQKPITKQKITGVVGGAARLKIVLDEKARLEDENRRYHKELEAMPQRAYARPFGKRGAASIAGAEPALRLRPPAHHPRRKRTRLGAFPGRSQ